MKKEPIIIAFMHKKGGCGKSTLSITLATELSVKHKVMLIDTDTKMQSSKMIRQYDIESIKSYAENHPKSAIAQFGTQTKDFTLIYPIISATNQVEFDKAIALAKANQIEYIIIDSPGAVENIGFLMTINVANYIIIPIFNDVLNKIASVEFAHYLNKIKNQLPNLKNYFGIANNFKGSIDSFVEYITEHKIPVLRSIIPNRESSRDGHFRSILPISRIKGNEDV